MAAGKRLGGGELPVGVSQANPAKLCRYATDGMAMILTLQGTVTALSESADHMARSGMCVAGMADLVSGLEELCADWYHLDDFAGDVANAFYLYLGPTRVGGSADFVVQTRNLDRSLIGFADRQAAIRQGEALAHEFQALMDAIERGDPVVWNPPHTVGGGGTYSLEQIERLANAANMLASDPAASIAFVQAMGVDGMAALRHMFQGYANQAREVDRPQDGFWTQSRTDNWLDDQMIPFAAVLHTAMATTQTDSDRAGLGDGSQLSDQWVDSFAAYDGDRPLDYSRLVLAADLPADVLVDVGDHHADQIFAPTGPRGTADPGHNLLTAIAANPDAATGWLRSDGIEDGTRNIELVLTYDRVSIMGVERYHDFAEVVEAGLTNPNDDVNRSRLMEETIQIVGAEGDTLPDMVYRGDDALAHMRGALAAGLDANMRVVDHMINQGWTEAHLGEGVPQDARYTHDFLREVMVDDEAAYRISGSYERYALEQLETLEPHGPDSDRDGTDDRTQRLRDLGALEGTIVQAQSDAMLGEVQDMLARQQARAELFDAGVDGATFALGFVPYFGTGIDAAAAGADMAQLSAGQWAFPADTEALAGALDEATANEM